LEVFPENSSKNFYITGESYAGKYIPNIANYIVNQNLKVRSKNNGTIINLKGIMIGNGLVNPIVQYPAYLSYAIHHHLIDRKTVEKVQPALKFCKGLLEQEQQGKGSAYLYCQNVLDLLLIDPNTKQ